MSVPASIPGLPSGFTVPSLDGLDLSKHDSLAPVLIRVDAAFIGIIVGILVIRIYVRAFIVRKVGADDYLMLAAGVAAISVCIIGLNATKHGLGRHVWDLDVNQVIVDSQIMVKTLMACQVMYISGVTLAKASIMASYLRIFPNETFRRLIYGTGAVVFAIWVCGVFVTIFQCAPVQAAWDFTMGSKRCIHILPFYYVTAGFGIATDLILCTLPLPQFWKLNLALKERAVVCILFGFGFFATVASCIRLTQLHNLGEIDVTYSCVASLMWSIVEVGTAILCASVPSIKPLISRVLPGRVFSTHRRTGQVSAISGPYDLKHLSGMGGSLGLDSRNSRMSLAKTGTVTRVYSSGRISDEEGSRGSEEAEIGMAVTTSNSSPPRKSSDLNHQVKVTHNIEVVTS